MNFGKKLYELRRTKNITQDELAAELGVTAAAVSKWENGYTLPDILMLCSLADYFDVTTDELLGKCINWKYAVVAAANAELGNKIAALAQKYGIRVKSIHTNYNEAVSAGVEDASITYLLVGYYEALTEEEWEIPIQSLYVCQCIYKTDPEILDGLTHILSKFG